MIRYADRKEHGKRGGKQGEFKALTGEEPREVEEVWDCVERGVEAQGVVDK